MSCKGEGRKQKGSTQEKGGDSLRCYKNKKKLFDPCKGEGRKPKEGKHMG